MISIEIYHGSTVIVKNPEIKKDGKISRESFWALMKFRYLTHQICFNTKKALKTIEFKEANIVHK